VLLVASDARDLAALAADLQLRHGVQVGTLALDLAVAADPGARVMEALAGLPTIRALLLPVGMSRSDDDGSLGPAAIGQLLAINLHAPIAVAHALRRPANRARCRLQQTPARADAISSMPQRNAVWKLLREFVIATAYCAAASLDSCAAHLTFGMKRRCRSPNPKRSRAVVRAPVRWLPALWLMPMVLPAESHSAA
jgi:hypothetical protein